MGERIAVLILGVAAIISADVLGWKAGIARGRYKQQQEDAAWYAAHPVVKEVEVPGTVHVIKQEMTGPRSMKMWIEVPKGWELIDQYPPPKPKKQSKRPTVYIDPEWKVKPAWEYKWNLWRGEYSQEEVLLP